MKILFSLFALIMLNKECNQKNDLVSTETLTTTEISEKMNQEKITFIYEATSRGFFQKIWISKDSVIISKDLNQTEKSTYKCTEEEWDNLLKMLNKVDIKSLPTLESPTAMRHYDGAAHASFTIINGDEETTSNTFDHEHPPKAIKELVDKVLSIKEKHQKQ